MPPSPDRRLELLDQPDAIRELIGECELTGKRTIFERAGRSVAVVVSYDEYLALRETLEIANDTELRAHLAAAEENVKAGAMLLPEELFE
ncbi:MAG: prevent-host-death family protein [Acidobacteria bacterium]|nr:prevent-host-death family protein [Acidobacteriota bacterium]